ncbi:MAG: sugar phosphate nucleotidyltransferase [Terriglobales bacterium]
MTPAPDTAILCGGQGTRLRAVLGDLPKPMAALGGRPLLESLVRWAAAAGSTRVVLCAGVGASHIREHFTHRDWGAEVVISVEPEPLGTGGALRLALPMLRSPAVLVLNGDSFLPAFHLAALLGAPAHHAAGTLVVVPASGRDDAGRIRLDGAGRITAFEEKLPSSLAASAATFLNAGVYLFQRTLLESIPAQGSVSLERELLPAWIGAGLAALVHNGELVDIGTPARFETAQTGSPWPALN